MRITPPRRFDGEWRNRDTYGIGVRSTLNSIFTSVISPGDIGSGMCDALILA